MSRPHANISLLLVALDIKGLYGDQYVSKMSQYHWMKM